MGTKAKYAKDRVYQNLAKFTKTEWSLMNPSTRNDNWKKGERYGDDNPLLAIGANAEQVREAYNKYKADQYHSNKSSKQLTINQQIDLMTQVSQRQEIQLQEKSVKISKLRKEIRVLQSRVDEHDDEVIELDDYIGKLEEDLTQEKDSKMSLQTTVEALRFDFEASCKKIAQLETEVSELKERQDKTQQHLTVIDKRIVDIHKDCKNIEAKVDNIFPTIQQSIKEMTHEVLSKITATLYHLGVTQKVLDGSES